jgi:hypothetical protein
MANDCDMPGICMSSLDAPVSWRELILATYFGSRGAGVFRDSEGFVQVLATAAFSCHLFQQGRLLVIPAMTNRLLHCSDLSSGGLVLEKVAIRGGGRL